MKRNTAIAVRPLRNRSRSHGTLALGSLSATVLGAVAALEFDRIVAVGARLRLPAVHVDLLIAGAVALLACGTAVMVGMVVFRAIRRDATRPYRALTDQMEDLADGRLIGDLSSPGSGVDINRLLRAAAALQVRLTASEHSEAALQARYNGLCHENADERRMLMRIVLEGRRDQIVALAPPPAETPSEETSLDLPPWPVASANAPSGQAAMRPVLKAVA